MGLIAFELSALTFRGDTNSVWLYTFPMVTHTTQATAFMHNLHLAKPHQFLKKYEIIHIVRSSTHCI